MALKTMNITRLQGKLSFRIGAPPVGGKPWMGVVLGGIGVSVGVSKPGVVEGVPKPGVAEGVPKPGVAVTVAVVVAAGCARHAEPVMTLLSNVTAPV
jgi:hypothetical protein